MPQLPILAEHEQVEPVGLLLIAGDRGLAGAFNSNIVRAGVAAGREHEREGRTPVYFASGRRPASSLTLPRAGAGRRASSASPTAPRTPTRGGSPSG